MAKPQAEKNVSLILSFNVFASINHIENNKLTKGIRKPVTACNMIQVREMLK